MPKTTHQHQKLATNTDQKFSPDDEGLYAREKQEFQGSEQEKRTDEDAPEKKAQRNKDRADE